MNNKYGNYMMTENEEERTIDLRELFSLFLSKALWILLCVAVCAAGAAAYTTATYEPAYKSTAVIYVNDGNMMSTGNLAIATYLAEDYAKTVKLRTILEQTLTELGIESMTYKQVSANLSVSLETESRIVTISYTDTVADRAQKICRKICEVSKARFEELTNVERVSIYEEASLPEGPTGPGMMTNVLFGAVIGFVLPCALILALYMIDDRIKTTDDVLRTLNLSTLGDIPYHREKE